MKKILALIAAMVLVVSLTCCQPSGGGNSDGSESGGSSEATTVTSSGNGASSSTVGVNSSTVGGATSTNVGEITQNGAVQILPESCGSFESAGILWKIDGAVSGYNVYYKATSSSDYTQIDNELIRKYDNFWRADVLGLAAGEYDFKVTPIKNSVADDSNSSIFRCYVSAHIREGFAFSDSSPYKTASGAYNDDGTLKENAQILYLTKDNMNTVTLSVIKDSKGKIEVGTGIVSIMGLRQKGYDNTPLALRFIGKIDDTAVSGLNTSGYVQVKGCYNVTLEGIGDDTTLYGWSFLVRAASNVEIRNFGIMMFKDDGISMDTDNNNIWVHNNDFFYGAPGSDSDQVKGDGSCDNKLTSYITVSCNHFWDSGKAILCGMADVDNYYATFHRNWFDHSDSRHPRIRVGTVHVYNNFYDGVSKYGIGATTASSCFAESNYFLNTKKPILISMQGTDIASGEGAFSSESGGMIKAFGNIFDATAAPIDYSVSSTNFDCYTVQNKSDTVPSGVVTIKGGTGYNNFDTASTIYVYAPLTAGDVPTYCRSFVGRVGGGDFKWTFTAADNSNYGVNSALKAAIVAYQTKLVSVGGNAI